MLSNNNITVAIHLTLAYGIKTVLGISAEPSDISRLVVREKINYIICGTAQAEKRCFLWI